MPALVRQYCSSLPLNKESKAVLTSFKGKLFPEGSVADSAIEQGASIKVGRTPSRSSQSKGQSQTAGVQPKSRGRPARAKGAASNKESSG